MTEQSILSFYHQYFNIELPNQSCIHIAHIGKIIDKFNITFNCLIYDER